MRRNNTLLMIVTLLGAITCLPTVLAAGRPVADSEAAEPLAQWRTSAEVLTSQEEADMLFMREEEKLARDVYIFLFALWNNPVFENISTSEQRHMDSMAVLLDNYGLADPVLDDNVGAFTNPDLARLFAALTARGQTSELEALKVGAFIEEVDMRDIQTAIENAGHPDIVQTYDNLLRGSRNHLRAFVRAIESLGVVYEAQVLTQTEVDAIVDSPVERAR